MRKLLYIQQKLSQLLKSPGHLVHMVFTGPRHRQGSHFSKASANTCVRMVLEK